MIDLLTSLFAALSPLWEMSLTAAYAAIVVALLRLVLKKRAPRRVVCLLWLVVFARLLVPVSLESPLSIVPDAQQVRQVQDLPARLTGMEPPGPVQNPAQDGAPAQNPVQGQPEGVTGIPVSQGGPTAGAAPALTAPGGTERPRPEPAQSAFPWQALIAGVWLAGALAMGGYGLISYLRIRRGLFDAIRAQDGAWEHPRVASPFILGMVRPRIYLPAGLRGQPRRFILCHERAHLRRLDHVLKPVCWAALALHWFNPLVWVAFLLMSRDIEAACDEAVIRQLGAEVKADYSATLLSLATNGRVPAPCPLAFDEGNARGRIKNVLSYRRPALWIVGVSAVAAVLAAVCLLTDPVSAAPEDEPDPEASSSQNVESSPAPEEWDEPWRMKLHAGERAAPWMLEVLAGQRGFQLRGVGSVGLDERGILTHEGEDYWAWTSIAKAALIDLDRDGADEMVLWPKWGWDDSVEIAVQTGLLILRQEGEEICAYHPDFSSFGYLKEDGTFYWNDGYYQGGIATAAFDGGVFRRVDVSWCDGAMEEYYVDGQASDREGYQAAIYAQDHKEEVLWFAYEGEKLWPILSDPIRPDSLEFDRQPRDLTREELDYFQEYFDHGFGQCPSIRSKLLVSIYDNPREIDLFRTFYDGMNYVSEVSRAEYDALGWTPGYASIEKITGGQMDQALKTYLGVTMDRTYKVGLENFGYLPQYDAYYNGHTDTEALLYTMKSGRINQDGTISVFYEADGALERNRVVTVKEIQQIYQSRIYYQVVSNVVADPQDPFAAAPSAQETASPPEQSAAPAPSQAPAPSAAPAACEHGLDNALYDFSGGSLVIRCELDGTGYPVPIITEDNWVLQYHKDLDGDGHIEHLFSRNDASFSRKEGILYVVDVQDGALNTYTFDPSCLAEDFNSTVSYEFVGEQQVMNFTYQGYGMQVDLSEQWSAMMNHGRSYYPIAYASETFYSFDGADIDMMIPVYLEGGFGGHICYLSWSKLKYTGSGFQVLNSSFGYRMPEMIQ